MAAISHALDLELRAQLVETFRSQNESSPIELATVPVLVDGRMPRGQVVQFASMSGLSSGTCLALDVCWSAQNQAFLHTGQPCWCAFVDPGRSLHAPGVAAHGVHLDRLLVMYPPVQAIGRSSVRLAQSGVFEVVVIDLHGVPGASISLPLAPWRNIVRRLSIAARQTNCCVLLLTDHRAAVNAGLPVAMRIELQRPGVELFRARIGKERHARIGGPVQWRYQMARLEGACFNELRQVDESKKTAEVSAKVFAGNV